VQGADGEQVGRPLVQRLAAEQPDDLRQVGRGQDGVEPAAEQVGRRAAEQAGRARARPDDPQVGGVEREQHAVWLDAPGHVDRLAVAGREVHVVCHLDRFPKAARDQWLHVPAL
jgi:hypothetical protein